MPPIEWENLDDFLDPHEFGVMAESQKDGTRFPIILEEQVMSRELGTYDINAAAPSATAKEKDVVHLKKRDHLVIGGISYWLVRDPLSDGTGIALLELSRSERERI